MPSRKILFVSGEIYHVTNRGIFHQSIFSGKRDHLRFINLIDFYRYPPLLSFSHHLALPKERKGEFLARLRKEKPLVEIFSFCLMPNHFHLLLKQLQDKGISTMLRNLQDSYARYFNIKKERQGPLFRPMFRAVRIETDEQLLHVSRYIHLNPCSSFITRIEDLANYPWSSLPEFLGERETRFTNIEFILSYFKKRRDYQEFVFNQAEYQRELEKIKHLTLE